MQIVGIFHHAIIARSKPQGIAIFCHIIHIAICVRHCHLAIILNLQHTINILRHQVEMMFRLCQATNRVFRWA